MMLVYFKETIDTPFNREADDIEFYIHLDYLLELHNITTTFEEDYIVHANWTFILWHKLQETTGRCQGLEENWGVITYNACYASASTMHLGCSTPHPRSLYPCEDENGADS